MDQATMDAAAKALNAATSRRRGIGAALAILIGVKSASGIVEAKRPEANGAVVAPEPTKRPCGDGSKKANQCRTNGDCCTGLCEPQTQQRHRKNKKHGNRHRKSGRCYCIASGESCAVDANCCSGICLDGVCGPVPACYFGNCDGCCGGIDGEQCITGEQSELQCGTHGEMCMVCDGATTICCDGVCSLPIWNEDATISPSNGSFNHPMAIVASPDGYRMYVVSRDNGQVFEFARPSVDLAWVQYSSFGSLGFGPTEFQFPTGIAVSADGLTAYVVDSVRNRVSIWARGALASTTWIWQSNVSDASLQSPQDCVISEDQLKLVVTNYATSLFSVFTRGNTSQSFSLGTTNGSGGGSGYSGIALSADETTIYITDINRDHVEVWLVNGTMATSFGSTGSGWYEMGYPGDVAVSGDNLTVYVADLDNDRVSVWSRPSVLSNTWSNQSVIGTLDAPWGVSVLPNSSELWITSFNTNVVEQLVAGCYPTIM